MTTFSYTSGDPNNLVAGNGASMGDIQGPFVDLRTFLNGRSLNEDNLPVSLLQKVGLSDSSGQKGRGASVIATTGTRTNVAFGALSDAADQVSGIVLPTTGLIMVAYQATWQNTVASAGRAAIFIGANQLKVATVGSGSPAVQQAVGPASINSDSPLASFPVGLNSTDSTSYAGDVTTGQAVGIAGTTASGANQGASCLISAAAGTYTVSVQFAATSGTVTAKNRRLYVWTVGF